MNDNIVFPDVIRAQDAYNNTAEAWKDLDTSPLLLAADHSIKESSKAGFVTATLGGITHLPLAEKFAVQMSELGYRTLVQSGGLSQLEPAKPPVPWYSVGICWALMPENRRDAFTV